MIQSEEMKPYLTKTAKRHGGTYVFLDGQQPARHLVPRPLRQKLIHMVHTAQRHLGSAYNLTQLRKSYFWPTMAKDTREHVKKCKQCALAEVARFAAHKMYAAAPSQAPTCHVAIDFKGMNASKRKSKEIAVFIDLSNLYLALVAQPDRTSKITWASFKDAILNVWGYPEVVYSDHAKELVHGEFAHQCKFARIRQRSTLGHNPRGNSTVERVMRFLNKCFRTLSDVQYNEWDEHLSDMCAAWNQHEIRTLGCSPHEARHGMAMRTRATLAGPQAPVAEPQLTTPAQIAKLGASVKAYQQIASATQQWHRKATAEKLNAVGHKRVYESGERVKIFIPPTAGQATKAGRKAKHMHFYRPATVVSKDTDTTYTLHDDAGRTFRRHVMNIAPYGVRQDFDILETGGDTGGAEESKSAVAQPASAAPTAKECPADTNALAVGEFIALRDDPSAAQFHIGKIVDKDADKINVHVYGTQNHSIKVAKYKPLWMVLGQSSKGSQVEFKLPKEEDRDERRWVWDIDVTSLPALVVARRLRLQGDRRLDNASRQLLDTLPGTLTLHHY